MADYLPCLLERWSSERAGRARSWHDVRRDVVRNLQWLMNTEAWTPGTELPPAVRDSVLCFGVSPYSGRPQSSLDPAEIAWDIRSRIIAFETRIDRHTLNVYVTGGTGGSGMHKLRFTVHGYLRADPLPIEFVVQTDIDPETGTAQVHD